MRATLGLVVRALLTGRALGETLAEQGLEAYEAMVLEAARKELLR